jgi:hypothetical protein
MCSLVSKGVPSTTLQEIVVFLKEAGFRKILTGPEPKTSIKKPDAASERRAPWPPSPFLAFSLARQSLRFGQTLLLRRYEEEVLSHPFGDAIARDSPFQKFRRPGTAEPHQLIAKTR